VTFYHADAAFEAALARHLDTLELDEELAQAAEDAGFDSINEFLSAMAEDEAERRAELAREEVMWG
jgi:hypothetical protein